MSEKGKNINLIAGVEEKDLDDFLFEVLKVASHKVSKSHRLSFEEDKLQALIQPMKELFFMKDGKYGGIKTLEERWDILLGEISKMTGATLYNPYNSNDNKNIILFSRANFNDIFKTGQFLTEEKREELCNSTRYGEERNFSLFWRILEKLSNEMFLANRRKLRKDGNKFEPRHPTSIPAKYMKEESDSCAEWLKISNTIQDQNKHSITAEKIENMVSRSDVNTFVRLLIAYKHLKNNRNFGEALIDSLWKESNGDKGYFEKNGISAESLENPNGEDKNKIIQLAKNFIESYMSSEQVQKKLDNIIMEIENTRNTMQNETVRAILPLASDCTEMIYESIGGCERSVSFEPYKKTDVTDKIFDNINKLPLGSFVKRLIEEGGTNLTADSIMSVQFARGANNAFIVTGEAIPVGNILGTSEMPEILKNVSKNAEQGKNFADNNPVIPLTNKKPLESLENSEVLFVTGEYMLNQWKKKHREGKLKNSETKKKFTEELYNDLKKRVAEYMGNREKLAELDKRLEKVKNTQILEKPEIYELDNKKIKHLEEAIYNDVTGDKRKKENAAKRLEAKNMNEIALKLQKLSLLENYMAMEDKKKSSRINQTVEKLSPSPASNFRKNRLTRKNSFVDLEADKKEELKKDEHRLLN
ncbi:MAG: hypothetical protein LBP39_00880 [Rickettsiales bacterium]|jgi:hypothetical protein|nr:hypothetical protein [Rickettsiales bacterium]